jgi:O-antigen ligase
VVGLYLKLDCIKAIESNAASRSMAITSSLTPRRIALVSLSLTAAGLPLYVVRWHYGPLPTTLLETIIGVTVVAYLATLWSERRLPHARTWFDIPVALLLLAGVISVLDAPSPVAALGIYRAYFLEAVACFYIAVDLLRTRREVMNFVLVAGAAGGVYAVGEILAFLNAVVHHNLNLSAAPSFLNTSANADALYLEAPFAFALAFALFGARTKERIVAAGLFGVIALGYLLAFSRASYLAAVVLAAILILNAQTPRLRLWALGGLVLLGLIVVEVPFVNQRFLTLANSVENREGIYREAVQMLFHRPILGAGIAGFPLRVAPFRPSGAAIQIYPHDIWLTTWSELGLLGVIAFAVIFFGALIRGARALAYAVDVSRPLLWGSIGSLVLWGVHGLFDSPYWKNDLSVQFWLVLALQVVAIRLATASPDRPSPSPAPRKPT